MSTQINEKSSPFHFQAHALRKSTNRTCLESSWLCLKLRRCLLASLLFTVTIPYSFFKASLCFLLLLLFSHFYVIPWAVAHQAPRPWNSLSKNIGVGCHALLQGIFPTHRVISSFKAKCGSPIYLYLFTHGYAGSLSLCMSLL